MRACRLSWRLQKGQWPSSYKSLGSTSGPVGVIFLGFNDIVLSVVGVHRGGACLVSVCVVLCILQKKKRRVGDSYVNRTSYTV